MEWTRVISLRSARVEIGGAFLAPAEMHLKTTEAFRHEIADC